MEEVLRRLIVEHSEDAQRLLKVVTTAEHSVPWAVAPQAAELGRRARQALDDLRMDKLLRSGGPEDSKEVEINHDRIRRAVEGMHSPSEQKTLH
jgi:hypothetical protein